MTVLSPNETSLKQDLEHILLHTRELWDELRGRNIFITGGTGFFGRWLLESFAYANRALRLDASVTVLSRDPQAFSEKAPRLTSNPAIHFVTGDVRKLTAADLPSARFDFVIHAATEASAKLNAENPLLMLDTIVEGTRAALEFAAAVGARRFLLTSSGAVYGPQPSGLTHIPEDYLGGPDCTQLGSAYGEGKRMAELLCAGYAKDRGLQPVIARCFAFVGPFLPLNAHFAIGNFIRDALAGGPIRVGGDGTPFRSYLYAADLAIWLWTILFKGEPMRPYNVGSTNDLTIAELAQTVRMTVNEKVDVIIAQEAKTGVGPARYVPANARATNELHLAETVDLVSALRKTARFALPNE